MTFITYNRENGSIVLQMEETEIDGACANIEIPSGKEIVGMDITTNPPTPIFEDKPISIEERLAILEASQNDQDDVLDYLLEGAE